MAKRKRRSSSKSKKSNNDYSFLVFLAIIGLVIIVICFIPKDETKKKTVESNSTKKSTKVVSNIKSNKNNKKVDSNSDNNSNKEEKKKEDKYDIEYDEENQNLDHGITMTTKKAVVSNGLKEDSSKKITNYLDKVIDDAAKNYKEQVSDAKGSEGYTFNYKYSLVEENNKYLVFKLDYEWQAGGPYPVYSSEYYMFNKNNGNVVEFDDLFTKDIKNKVKENIVKKINKIYEKQNDEYSDELSNDVFIIGFYVLSKDKLTFVLPRGYFTAPAYGSLTIDIDEDVYKDYIK
jgi:hypothetical protein